MKKALSLLLALMMVFSLAACGGDSTESTAPESTAPESTAPESTAPESDAPESDAPEAEGWVPEQSVDLIIPYSAGGSSDLLGRAVESVWSKYCDQPLVVTNVPGGGGVTGSMQVSASEPDGYTLCLAYGSGCDMSMPYLQELDYDPFEALDPVCLLSEHVVMVAVPADSEFNSMADVVAWAEENPDTPITASVSTANGTVHLTFLALAHYTGLNMNIVPHDGTAGSITDLLSGSFMIGGGHPSDVLSYVQSGQLKLIGAATEEREPSFPDVPTLKEQGIDFAAYGSIKGVAVPPDTPAEIVAYYEELFRQICEDEDFQETMANMAQPVMYMGTAEFDEYFTNANTFYKTLIEDLGLAYYS